MRFGRHNVISNPHKSSVFLSKRLAAPGRACQSSLSGAFPARSICTECDSKQGTTHSVTAYIKPPRPGTRNLSHRGSLNNSATTQTWSAEAGSESGSGLQKFRPKVRPISTSTRVLCTREISITVTVIKYKTPTFMIRKGEEKNGQIAIEPNFAPGLIQTTMGRTGVRRLKSA
jgi:hypothetical protein